MEKKLRYHYVHSFLLLEIKPNKYAVKFDEIINLDGIFDGNKPNLNGYILFFALLSVGKKHRISRRLIYGALSEESW